MCQCSHLLNEDGCRTETEGRQKHKKAEEDEQDGQERRSPADVGRDSKRDGRIKRGDPTIRKSVFEPVHACVGV